MAHGENALLLDGIGALPIHCEELTSMCYDVFKRACDVAAAFICLALLAPFMASIAIVIRFDSPGTALYRGMRVGRNGRLFSMFKFRTMATDSAGRGALSTANDDPRITRVGRWLRATKVDELPQLLNVLRGEMSFVGPRPQVASDVAKYTQAERLLLNVRPGITDYASIRFRNEGEILRGYPDPDLAYMELIRPEKIRLGLEYVNSYSLMVDAAIILGTIGALLWSSRTAASARTGPDETSAHAR